jgi:hypothetical protein
VTFAHRVGVWSALIAVAVLSLELAGAVAWTSHHSVPRVVVQR